jgi:hypothetical protein
MAAASNQSSSAPYRTIWVPRHNLLYPCNQKSRIGNGAPRGRRTPPYFVIGALSEPAFAHTGDVLLLVPADPLRPRRADGHFALEAVAARDAGHDVALSVEHLLGAANHQDRAASLTTTTLTAGRGCWPSGTSQ